VRVENKNNNISMVHFIEDLKIKTNPSLGAILV
jgi:hypothetical protein